MSGLSDLICFTMWGDFLMLIYTDEYMTDLYSIKNIVPNIEVIKQKKILITGAGGLICSAAVDAIMELNISEDFKTEIYVAARDEQRITSRFYKWDGRKELHFLKYDALKPIEFKDIFDFIIHGASNANPGSYSLYPVETMLSNFIGINTLLEMIKEAGAGRILYISSSEVYGKKDDRKPYTESDYQFLDILNPRACYPSSKRAAETLCACYKKEYGVDYVIVRPGHIYGPTMTESDNRASSQFPREVKAGNNIIMKSRGTQLRSYCYVLDCVSAILTVLINGFSGDAYNISNKKSIATICEMAKEFAEAAGKKIIFENASKEEFSGYNLMDNSSLSGDKIESLGWIGLYDLKTGVKKTLNSLK